MTKQSEKDPELLTVENAMKLTKDELASRLVGTINAREELARQVDGLQQEIRIQNSARQALEKDALELSTKYQELQKKLGQGPGQVDKPRKQDRRRNPRSTRARLPKSEQTLAQKIAKDEEKQ